MPKPPPPPHPPTPPTPPVNDTVTAWINSVIANGGARPSQSSIKAMSDFMNAIAGLQSRIWQLNVIAPDSIIAMRTPLIHPYGNNPWVPKTVGAGFAETLTVNGWRGSSVPLNGIVYDTGVIASLVPSFSLSNGGLSIYCPDNPPTAANIPLAGYIANSSQWAMGIVPHTTLNDSRSAVWNGGQQATAGGATSGGFYSVNRLAANQVNLAWGNSLNVYAQVGTNPFANTTVPILSPLGVGGVWNGDSTAFSVCNQSISFFAAHDGFSLADSTILFNAVQALRVAFGGGFI